MVVSSEINYSFLASIFRANTFIQFSKLYDRIVLKRNKEWFLLFGNQFTQANKYAGIFLFFWCCIANYNFVRLRDLLFLYSLVHSMIM